VNFTVVPRANVVAAVPLAVCVAAVLASVAVSRVYAPPAPAALTVNVAVPTLLLESEAVTVTFPERPEGTFAYAMKFPPGAVTLVGVVVTT